MSKRKAAESANTAPAKTHAGYKLNINNALDKAVETVSFKAALELPPSALQGLAEHADATLHSLGVKTVAELAEWKFFRAARAIVALAATEEDGPKGGSRRDAKNQMNLNAILDKEWEHKTLKDIAAGPVELLQGVGPVHAAELAKLHITTVEQLASWKFAHWAAAIADAATFENADFHS